MQFYDIPLSTKKTLEKKTSCHGYHYFATPLLGGAFTKLTSFKVVIEPFMFF